MGRYFASSVSVFVSRISGHLRCHLVFTSGAIATAKSRAPKFQSEEGEVVVWVIFPPGKI